MRLLAPFVAVGLVVLAPLPLTAQDSGLHVGDHVRWLEGSERLRGEVVGLTPVRVRLSPTGEERILPPAVGSLERRLRPNRKGQGLFIGFATGLLAGAVIGLADGDDDCGTEGCFFYMSAATKALVGGAALGTVGAIIGALAAPGARWARVASGAAEEPRVSLLLGARHAGVRLRF